MRIIICGIGGKVGKTLYEVIQKDKSLTLVAGVDKFALQQDFEVPVYRSFAECETECDIIMDFSRAEAIYDIIPYALAHNCGVIVATTGHTAQDMEYLREASRSIAVFKTTNMSLGVNLLINLSRQAARFLGNTYDIEIIEYHHNQKVDSPSGTALSIADAISEEFTGDKEYTYGRHDKNKKRSANEIGIHAVRGGTIVGKHDVMYIGRSEIVTLSHQSESREVFAFGAIRAAKYISTRANGMYNMNDIIGEDFSVTTVTGDANATLITIPRVDAIQFYDVLDRIANASINLDMISETRAGADTAVSFTVDDTDYQTVQTILDEMSLPFTAKADVAKLLIEGAGMEHKHGVARDALKVLRDVGAEIFAITTSETNITCCIDTAKLTASVDALTKRFNVKKD